MLNKKLLGSVSSPPSDDNFENVTLLLSGDGTNGAQNNTFLDSSTNNFTITRNGNTTQGSFSPYGSNWSNYFDGSSYLTLPSNSALTLSGDFTIEFFVNFTTTASGQTFWAAPDAAVDRALQSSAGAIYIYYDGTAERSFGTYAAGQWNHIALSRTGSTVQGYLNGVRGFSITDSGTLEFSAAQIFRRGRTPAGDFITGYGSNVRIIKGTGIYTGTTITVPTSPLTAITNTVLLTCQSNRFIDNSTNNFTITPTGSPSVQRFSPFNPTAPYSTSVIGGSGYFDGSGDSLNLASNAAFGFGTGDFTIEFWTNPFVNGSSNGTTFFDFRTGLTGTPWTFYLKNTGSGNFVGAYTSYGPGAMEAESAFISLNTWNHIVVQRTSGTWAVYLNGISQTLTGSGYNGDLGSSKPLRIGIAADGSSNPYTGYLANIRIVKGTAVYTANFTPPTAPLTVITNTQLLTNFANAGIPDLAMQNNLETVGNAQVSTSVKKYGTGSLAFDGTGDSLLAPLSPQYSIGTGNFTIEFWVYLNAQGTYVFYDQRTAENQVSPTIYTVSGALKVFVNGVNAIEGATLNASQWYHIALARSGTSTKLFVDGTQSGSTYTDSNNYINNPIKIGINYASSFALNGNIDDLRITCGIARYTANFTPPASALPSF